MPKKEPSKTKVKTNKANGKAGTGAKSEAAKARDEARRKMLEERKRQMKLKQQQQCEQKKENEVPDIINMVAITWLAFIGDAFATLLNQVGFVLQKLAHRDQEATQTRSRKD